MSENMSEQKLPSISVSAQYIKDLSFENFATPGSMEIKTTPSIDLSLGTAVNKLAENFYEVVIKIEATAIHEKTKLFHVELAYAGIFNLENIPEEQLEPLLNVHCMSIIFPYARKIIADATQDGGFQPLMIEPIDFARFYNKKRQESGDADKDNVN
jgi:preprotein translocase subunit SecB